MERAISVKESLYDHLRMQIETLGISQKEKEAALKDHEDGISNL